MRKSGKRNKNGAISSSSQTNGGHNDFNDDVDALFKLPLAEFTGARNALAVQLKKHGRGEEAAVVKALAKPAISAWAVNQLYCNHRETFDQLIESGERFHKAQTSGKVVEMRSALDARREVLTDLSALATSVLRDAGHNPSPDTIHRITTTLEALSVYASRSDAPRPGRLTHDIDPPGFESFGSFIPPAIKEEAGGRKQVAAGTPRSDTSAPARSGVLPKSDIQARAGQQQDKRKLEDARNAKIATARASLQHARKALTAARLKSQSLEAAQKKADAEAKKAEKRRRDVAEELKQAEAASERATQRARSRALELEEAASIVEEAEFNVEKASKELEKLFGEPSGT